MTISKPEKKILKYLGKKEHGDTFTGIANAIGVHRHTATKYIYKLIGEGKIVTMDISTAKVCFINKGGERA